VSRNLSRSIIYTALTGIYSIPFTLFGTRGTVYLTHFSHRRCAKLFLVPSVECQSARRPPNLNRYTVPGVPCSCRICVPKPNWRVALLASGSRLGCIGLIYPGCAWLHQVMNSSGSDLFMHRIPRGFDSEAVSLDLPATSRQENMPERPIINHVIRFILIDHRLRNGVGDRSLCNYRKVVSVELGILSQNFLAISRPSRHPDASRDPFKPSRN